MRWGEVIVAQHNPLVRVECLGNVLQRAGYATAFFQSAIGAFEDRPRLVKRMGFSSFEAWETIGGEPLGYLASDDLSLAPAFERWLDALPAQRPFFATLLTSATHHPYRLPQDTLDRLKAEGIDGEALKSEARYRQLVERADQLVGRLVASLAERGLRDRTLIVALGDHGEGFGDHGLRQHDNNYYEEGLRVPLVIAGPKVEAQELPAETNLLDVSPTLLQLLGFAAAPREGVIYGRNLLAEWSEPRTEYFSCFYEGECLGYQRGSEKVVVLPEENEVGRFDLARDPQESAVTPVRLDSPELQRLAELAGELRLPGQPPMPEVRFDNGWRCPAGGLCRHSKTPPGLVFKPVPPEECIKARRESSDGGTSQSLTLKNICSGIAICAVSFEGAHVETVRLRPSEAREVEMPATTPGQDARHSVDCRFQ